MDCFTHTLSKAEIQSGYLNLTPEDGDDVAIRGLPHKTPLMIVDRENRRTRAQKHHMTQVWGTFRQWMVENHAHAGMRILVLHWPHERNDGLHVLRVLVVRPTAGAAA